MIKLANNLTNLASKQADWGSTMAGLGTFAKEMFNPAGAMDWWRQNMTKNTVPGGTSLMRNGPFGKATPPANAMTNRSMGPAASNAIGQSARLAAPRVMQAVNQPMPTPGPQNAQTGAPAPQRPDANQVRSPYMNMANILPPAMMHGIQR